MSNIKIQYPINPSKNAEGSHSDKRPSLKNTDLKVMTAITIGLLSGLVAVLAMHCGFGFSLTDLKTIGISIGSAVLGSAITFAVLKIFHKHIPNNNPCDSDAGYSSEV